MDKTEFTKLKEDAMKFIQAQKYLEAIGIYDKIMQDYSGLERESKAVIFANRSAAYLSLKTESALGAAEKDAENAILQWPRWWKGYYCLARVQMEKEEWAAAEKSLKKALKCDPKSKESLKELGSVKTHVKLIAQKPPNDDSIEDEVVDDSFLELFQKLSFGDWKMSNDPLNIEIYGETIKEAAKNGSLTARRHLNIWKNLGLALEAFTKEDSAELVAALSKAIHINPEIIEIPEAFKPLIMERFKSHPTELDSVVCYVKINTENRNLFYIVQKYNGMFPEDDFLWEMIIDGYMTFQLNPVEALRVSRKALKQCPNSLLLLYSHAIVLCLQDSETGESVRALDAFLAKAPKDHEKVPSCFYRKAKHYLNIGNKRLFASFFKAGLAAEKNQLPCFLPYEYYGKESLQMAYDNYQRGSGGGRASSSRKQ